MTTCGRVSAAKANSSPPRIWLLETVGQTCFSICETIRSVPVK
ncbi:hypothetical protein DSM3645_03848 [Blastopirellula marina DSM 3645]|uniref:Uncharacterized protein n=1 Tax=Blastopirellula marina DSM 3645 TaxID=314230 RepID=A3ZV81_9BACT|nr:hypothetical protein DSM3645_03848 [Blastopirellula marina DSM 3645]